MFIFKLYISLFSPFGPIPHKSNTTSLCPLTQPDPLKSDVMSYETILSGNHC